MEVESDACTISGLICTERMQKDSCEAADTPLENLSSLNSSVFSPQSSGGGGLVDRDPRLRQISLGLLCLVVCGN